MVVSSVEYGVGPLSTNKHVLNEVRKDGSLLVASASPPTLQMRCYPLCILPALGPAHRCVRYMIWSFCVRA